MVLELPGGLFGQEDVRETNVETPTGTSYWSCSGIGFIAQNPETDDIIYNEGPPDALNADGGANIMFAQVNLPHGAIVTSAELVGSDGAGTWLLSRVPKVIAAAETMGTAATNTADTSISNDTIDNQNYVYVFWISLAAAKRIYGAYITYTT